MKIKDMDRVLSGENLGCDQWQWLVFCCPLLLEIMILAHVTMSRDCNFQNIFHFHQKHY